MIWPVLTTVAKAIPWVALAQQAPAILEAANRLRARSQPAQSLADTGPSAEEQLAALRTSLMQLEAQQGEVAEIVRQLALQSQEMVRGMEVLARKVRLLGYALLAVTGVAVAALVTSIG